VTSQEAQERLLEGNRRFREGKSKGYQSTPEKREDLLKGQDPFATIVCCSDSRVSPEIFFDQGLSDLFVISSAGGILDSSGIGSVEYAVKHLKTSLVVILGHESCGAVQAALQGADKEEGPLKNLLKQIEPIVIPAKNKKTKEAQTEEGVKLLCEKTYQDLLSQSPTVRQALLSKETDVKKAYFEIGSGEVFFL
jgi:carbonic anhydrase